MEDNRMVPELNLEVENFEFVCLVSSNFQRYLFAFLRMFHLCKVSLEFDTNISYLQDHEKQFRSSNFLCRVVLLSCSKNRQNSKDKRYYAQK